MKINVMLSRSLTAFALLTLSIGCANAETVLRYTDHELYGNMRTRAIKTIFFAAIEKESQGRLRIEAHWNGELSTSYDALRTLQEGKKADIGIVVPEYTPEQLPLFQIFKSFPLGPDNGIKQSAFFQHVFKVIPEFDAELAQNNLVNLQFFLGYPAAFFSTTSNMPLTHLQGTTWRTASFWHRAYLENAGGHVVKMPWNEQITEALKNGTLDGLLVNLDSGDDIHAQQAAKYIQLSPRLWMGHVYLLTMNKARWNSLSVDDKAAIQRAAAQTQRQIGPLLDTSLREMTDAMGKQGAAITWLSPAQLQSWQRVSLYQQEQQKWVSAQEAKGHGDSGQILSRVATMLNAAMSQ